MKRTAHWIQERPVVSFFLITFAITWGLGFSYIAVIQKEAYYLAPLVSIATCGPALAGIIITAVSNGQKLPKPSRNWSRWIVFLIALILCMVIAVLHNHYINGAPLSPEIVILFFFLLVPPVAFIVSAPYSRGTAVRAMIGSLLRLRGVAGWALLALIFVPGIALLSVIVSDLLGRQPASVASGQAVGASLLGLVAIKFFYQFFFFNATGEESGWSGFARPHLQARVSPLLTALIITLFWGPWHLFLWYAEGQSVFEAGYWLQTAVNLIPASIIITWLYNRSKGSILVAGTAHAAANTVFAFLPNLDFELFTVTVTLVALLLVLGDRMWQKLPAPDPAVSVTPRLAI